MEDLADSRIQAIKSVRDVYGASHSSVSDLRIAADDEVPIQANRLEMYTKQEPPRSVTCAPPPVQVVCGHARRDIRLRS